MVMARKSVLSKNIPHLSSKSESKSEAPITLHTRTVKQPNPCRDQTVKLPPTRQVRHDTTVRQKARIEHRTIRRRHAPAAIEILGRRIRRRSRFVLRLQRRGIRRKWAGRTRRPCSFQSQFLEHETVPTRKAVRFADAFELALALLARGEVALALSGRDEVLLDAVDVEHDDGAEGVVLREPKRAEEVGGCEDVVDNADDGQGGFEAGGDVF